MSRVDNIQPEWPKLDMSVIIRAAITQRGLSRNAGIIKHYLQFTSSVINCTARTALLHLIYEGKGAFYRRASV